MLWGPVTGLTCPDLCQVEGEGVHRLQALIVFV